MQPSRQTYVSYDADRGPTGLGGWLILPIIGLFVSILTVGGICLGLLADLQDGLWGFLTSPDSPAYHWAWGPLIVFECIGNVIVVASSALLLVFLFQKKPILPKLMVGLLAFDFLFMLVDSLVLLKLGPDVIPNQALREQVGWGAGDLFGRVARAALTCAIWIPYFLMSKRVKNTFVERRPVFPPTPYQAPYQAAAWVYPDSPRPSYYPAPPQEQDQMGEDLPR